MLRKCQLAGHKRAGLKTKNVLQCLQFAKNAIRQCKHGCKKRRKKKRKKRKEKDDRTLIRSNLTYSPLDLLWSRTKKRRNDNHKGFVDTSYHPLHKFTMPASCIVVTFTHGSLAALRAALIDHAERLNSLFELSWPNAEEVHEEMYALVDTLLIHGVDQKWFSTFTLIEGAEEMVATQEILAVSWGCFVFCFFGTFLSKILFHQCHRQRGIQLLAAFTRLIQNMSRTHLTGNGSLISALACLRGRTW